MISRFRAYGFWGLGCRSHRIIFGLQTRVSHGVMGFDGFYGGFSKGSCKGLCQFGMRLGFAGIRFCSDFLGFMHSLGEIDWVQPGSTSLSTFHVQGFNKYVLFQGLRVLGLRGLVNGFVTLVASDPQTNSGFRF